MKPAAEFVAAFTLLTRVRLPGAGATPAVPIARTIWALPLAGGIIGALAATVFYACSMTGMPKAIAATWTLAATLLLTGALHEDGLADTADGFGGGRTRERKLDIMRDSRIGSFGAISLILSLGARGTAIAALGQPARVLVALTVAGSLARAAILVLILVLRPARADGLAAGLRDAAIGPAAIGLAIAGVTALALLPPMVALRAILGMVIASLVIGWISHRQIGGYTGDVLGAGAVVTECLALSLLCGAAGWA